METRANGMEGEVSSNDAEISNFLCEVNDSVKENTKYPLKEVEKDRK